jgi:glycosyltransferase involved in cell wall biosynthesis
MTMPKISLIIPVYNAGEYLRCCVNSVQAQTFTDFECMLIDDNSSDNSLLICEEYARKDKRIKVIHNQQNKGSSQTRKIGYASTTGDYILCVDSDDWLENNMLDKLYQTAVSDNLDITWCNYYLDKENSEIQREHIKSSTKIEFLREVFTRRDFTVALWNKLIRRSLFSQIVFPVASQSEDIPITLQLIYYANSIGYLDDALYHHCFNSGSISQAKERKYARMEEVYANLKAATMFLKEKFGENIKNCLEPELSNYINKAKIEHLSHKETRDIKKLFELYPESNSNIFNRGFKASSFKKFLLFFATRSILFPWKMLESINPVLEFFYKNARTFYRVIIPGNIRDKIWSHRNSDYLDTKRRLV